MNEPNRPDKIQANPFAPGLLHRLEKAPRNIVIVRALRIGDHICATPAFRALRVAMPEAEITLIGLHFVRDLAERSPYLDRFVEFPGFPGMAEQFFEPHKALEFFERMQAESFDLAIQMNGSGVYSNPFTLMLGAGATAGFVRPSEPPGRLDAALPMPEALHQVRTPLALAEFLGAPAQGTETEFPLAPEDIAAAEHLLSGAQPPFIGVHPAAREATKRWSWKRFAAAGRELQRRHGGTVVVVGGPDEAHVANEVAQSVGGPCLNLVGRTSLPVLGAVIRRLAVLLTNDSGPAHIAYALKVPTVTIFGGTDPHRWGPQPGSPARTVVNPVPCWPCDYGECPVGYQCLEGISVDQVVDRAEEVVTI